MDKALRTYLTELAGTFFLVFLCAVTVCASYLPPSRLGVGLVGLAVAQGCILAALLSATTLVSDGCLNPAVTLTLWVTKRFEAGQTLALIAVQLIGAVAGGGLAVVLFNHQVLVDAWAGTPHLLALREAAGGGVKLGDLLGGVAVEAGLSFLLTLTIFATILDPRRPRLGGVPAGLALTGCVLAGYHLTGAAVNPARWFGSAVWQSTVPTLGSVSTFGDHPVYWMGPIIGALLAGILYSSVILPPSKGQ